MKRTLYLLGILLIPLTTFAQTLPTKVKVFMPEYIHTPKGSENWEEDIIKKIKTGNFGKQTTTVWYVFSDRENNTTYTTPSENATKYSSLSFTEKVYIADIKNEFALVFSDDNVPSTDGTISSNARYRGWIPVDNLLLWYICPQDQYKVYKKGVVIYSPSSEHGEYEKNPKFLFAPSSNAKKTTNQSNSLDFFYCIKTTVNRNNNKLYYLLSKEYEIKSKGDAQDRLILGWLSEDNLTEWNYRLLLEPTHADKNVKCYKEKKLYPCIFPVDKNGLNNARKFERDGIISNPLWIYDKFEENKRMNPYRMRNPIIDNSSNLLKVATLSTFGDNGTVEDYAKIKKRIEELKQALDNINVIFVIDATSSMKKYYPEVANSLEEIMDRDFSSNIKVGAVLYKDYTDTDKISIKPVNKNIQEVIGFINQKKDHLGSKDADDWEAMLLGLETALDGSKMRYNNDESNFIILIGDAGNQRKNPSGENWQEITERLAKKMSHNNINFMAYQVNHTGSKAYTDFALQIGVLQKQFSEKYKAQTRINAEYQIEKNGFYSLKRSNNNSNELPRYIKYKFQSSGQSETGAGLKSIITNNINEFQNIVKNNIDALSKLMNGSNDGLQKERVIEILRSLNWSNEEIVEFISTIEESNNMLKFYGWTAQKSKICDYNNIFDYVLLFSEEELTEIIHNFDKINESSKSDRKALQDAMLDVVRSMVGETSDIEQKNLDDLLKLIYGLPIKLKTCGNFSIADIIDENRVSDEILKNYIEQFVDKLDNLKRIQQNASVEHRKADRKHTTAETENTFISNDHIYFWIKLSEMPGVCE